MKPIYTQEEFNLAKSNDILSCQCYNCNNIFNVKKKYINLFLSKHVSKHHDYSKSCKYCSKKCKNESLKTKELVNCLNCNLNFYKFIKEIKKTKNHFCSKSCSASYNNKHKSTGNRRSKLEIWLEEQLSNLYPNLEIHYNQKSAINSELDIYVPSLNIAFELNGIFHYEPIYGVDKFQKIQENDISKSKACHEAKIDLCIIDTSGQYYFKESTSQKYLDIINNIIKERFLTS